MTPLKVTLPHDTRVTVTLPATTSKVRFEIRPREGQEVLLEGRLVPRRGIVAEADGYGWRLYPTGVIWLRDVTAPTR